MQGRHTIMALVALAAASALGQGLRAQQGGFAGAWLMEFPSRITNEGGFETVEMGHAHMTLRQSGDSLTGEWRAVEAGPDGKAAPARLLRGTATGTHATLEAAGVARFNRNGEESAVRITIRYDLDLAGDSLSGKTHVATTSDGRSLGPARDISGKREAAGAGT